MAIQEIKPYPNTYIVVFDVYPTDKFDQKTTFAKYKEGTFKRLTDTVFLLNTKDSMEQINDNLNKQIDVEATFIAHLFQPYFSTPQGRVEDWLDYILGQ